MGARHAFAFRLLTPMCKKCRALVARLADLLCYAA
jgi:hypothetical protein